MAHGNSGREAPGWVRSLHDLPQGLTALAPPEGGIARAPFLSISQSLTFGAITAEAPGVSQEIESLRQTNSDSQLYLRASIGSTFAARRAGT